MGRHRGPTVNATADSLRSRDHRHGALPEAPAPGELSERAGVLADGTEDAAVREPARAIRAAERLEWSRAFDSALRAGKLTLE
ncbi:hypothetical protein [Streptomyces sp. SLBN-134]|uniref:hypothetical protein n=1 Tax=Streptomyces sp. SLBN-134 TaxID=2768456 RepID=UPI00114FD122|nr:hypothetical protein [Streptomyces sp. SLBN-134]TQL24447.1 hypothetical protein FBY37_6535 [Streptomyces sp. SLBN-134]